MLLVAFFCLEIKNESNRPLLQFGTRFKNKYL